MDMEKYIEYGIICDRETYLKQELKELNEKKNRLGEELRDEMLDSGLAKLTVKLGVNESGAPVRKTLYIQRKLWAGHRNGMEALTQALHIAGFEDLVSEKVNTNTLSAMIREFDPDNNLDIEEIRNLLPEALRTEVKITEKVDLKARNA